MSSAGSLILQAPRATVCNDALVELPSRCCLGQHEHPLEIDPRRIKLGPRIAVGGFAEVFVGKFEGTVVAIKRLLESNASNLEQFEREVALLARIRHPNLILFMGFSMTPDMCIISEYMQRGCLFNILRQQQEKPLAPKLQKIVSLSIARGMAYLHSLSPPILHLDIKSPNILVDSQWRVKVADFGLSQMRFRTFVTAGAAGGGTPHWMAPEMLRSEHIDEKADVYSFGVILWEILTGKIPWEGMNPMQVVGAVCFQNRSLPLPESGDPFLISLVQKCCAPFPTERPSFQEILNDLECHYNEDTFKPISMAPARTHRVESAGGSGDGTVCDTFGHAGHGCEGPVVIEPNSLPSEQEMPDSRGGSCENEYRDKSCSQREIADHKPVTHNVHMASLNAGDSLGRSSSFGDESCPNWVKSGKGTSLRPLDENGNSLGLTKAGSLKTYPVGVLAHGMGLEDGELPPHRTEVVDSGTLVHISSPFAALAETPFDSVTIHERNGSGHLTCSVVPLGDESHYTATIVMQPSGPQAAIANSLIGCSAAESIFCKRPPQDDSTPGPERAVVGNISQPLSAFAALANTPFDMFATEGNPNSTPLEGLFHCSANAAHPSHGLAMCEDAGPLPAHRKCSAMVSSEGCRLGPVLGPADKKNQVELSCDLNSKDSTSVEVRSAPIEFVSSQPSHGSDLAAQRDIHCVPHLLDCGKISTGDSPAESTPESFESVLISSGDPQGLMIPETHAKCASPRSSSEIHTENRADCGGRVEEMSIILETTSRGDVRVSPFEAWANIPFETSLEGSVGLPDQIEFGKPWANGTADSESMLTWADQSTTSNTVACGIIGTDGSSVVKSRKQAFCAGLIGGIPPVPRVNGVASSTELRLDVSSAEKELDDSGTGITAASPRTWPQAGASLPSSVSCPAFDVPESDHLLLPLQAMHFLAGKDKGDADAQSISSSVAAAALSPFADDMDPDAPDAMPVCQLGRLEDTFAQNAPVPGSSTDWTIGVACTGGQSELQGADFDTDTDCSCIEDRVGLEDQDISMGQWVEVVSPTTRKGPCWERRLQETEERVGAGDCEVGRVAQFRLDDRHAIESLQRMMDCSGEGSCHGQGGVNGSC